MFEGACCFPSLCEAGPTLPSSGVGENGMELQTAEADSQDVFNLPGTVKRKLTGNSFTQTV